MTVLRTISALVFSVLLTYSNACAADLPGYPGLISDTLIVPKEGKDFLKQLFLANPGPFVDVIDNPAEYKLQVIYTKIDRDGFNKPVFSDFTFGADSTDYFYPASTVKMPVALLALQRLNELNIKGLDKFSTMLTGAD